MRIFVMILLLATLLFAACSGTNTGDQAPAAPSFTTDEFGNQLRPIDVAASTLYAEGTSARAVEEVRFNVWSGALKYKEGQITGAEGKIEVSSVSTSTEALDEHLITDDFFGAALFPTIELLSNEVVDADGGKAFKAQLTMKGVTKQIMVPFTPTQQGVRGDFTLNVEDFGVKYLGVNTDVRIVFDFTTRT